MIDTKDLCLSRSDQPSHDKTGTGTQIGCHHRCSVKLFYPWTWADEPCIRISAPKRRSSATCIKRFSKIRSLTIQLPKMTLIAAIHCACISVGNPGCGAVSIDTGVSSSVAKRESISPVSTVAPTSRIFCSNALIWYRRTLNSDITARPDWPTNRSRFDSISNNTKRLLGRTKCWNTVNPRRDVPSFNTCSHASRYRTKSTTSGSRAALLMTVSPSARTAAISIFSVPVTVEQKMFVFQTLRGHQHIL